MAESSPPSVSELARDPRWAATQIRERWAHQPRDPLLLAEGDYSPEPSVARRWFVFRIHGNRLEHVSDFWLRLGDEQTVAADLDRDFDLARGHCDAMFATQWEHAWCERDGHALAWSRDPARQVQADASGLVVDGRAIARARVARLHRGLSGAWDHKWLDLITVDGETLRLFEHRDPIAYGDPTYDGIDLLCDSAWTLDVARPLARALGVEITQDPDLP